MTEISLMEDPVYENDEFNLFKEAILKEPDFNYESGLDQHISDQMIYVASVDLTDVENEERNLIDQFSESRKKNRETAEKRNQAIKSLESRAKARLLSQHLDRTRKIKDQGSVQGKMFKDRAGKIVNRFKEAKKKLINLVSSKKQYAKKHIGKLKERTDVEMVNMFKNSKKLYIRVELCNAVKDKLPSAHYVILVSLWDRLGGSKLEKSKMKRITKPVMHGGRYFNNTLRFEEILELDVPAPDKLSSSMALGFELFLLKNRNVRFDKPVAYSYFPLINSDFNISEGKFKTSMMKGGIDMSIEKYSDMEVRYAKNIDDWLCNLYFTTKLQEAPEGCELRKEEDFEQFQYSVTGPDGLKARWEGWKRFKYIMNEVFQDMGFKAKKADYRQVWLSLVILLFCLWICRLTHYFGQWSYLKFMGIDVNEFAVYWVTFTLKYASDLHFGSILGFLIFGELFSIIFFLIFTIVAFLCYWYLNYFPSIGYKIGALYGLSIVIDPLVTLVESIIRAPLEDDWDKDPFLMSIYFEENASSQFFGPVVTILIYIVLFMVSNFIVNVYLIYIHMNGRIVDTYKRINELESKFFVPLDQEVGEKYLKWVVQKAHKYKTIEGDTRRVAAIEHKEKNENKPSTWEIAIFNVGKDKSLYRQFTKFPNGTIVEISIQRMNHIGDNLRGP